MVMWIKLFYNFWEYLYVFYSRQSILGLAILVLVGVILVLVPYKWIRPVLVEKVRLFRPNLPFRTNRKYIYYWPLKILSSHIATVIISLILFNSWNYFFLMYGEEIFVRPSPSHYNILVTKFTGADTGDRFGNLGIRDLMARELNLSADSITAKEVKISFSNSSCANWLEAKQLKSDKGFDMLIWGYTESGTDSLTVTTNIESEQRWSIIPAHSQSDSIHIDILRSMRFTMPVRYAVESEELKDWVRKTSLYGLTMTAIENELWKSADIYLNIFRSEFQNFERNYALTYSWFKLICINEICKTDTTRWDELLEVAIECDSISSIDLNFPKSFLSVLKWNAGRALTNLGKFHEAETYFKQSIEVDPSNINGYVNLSKVLFEQALYNDAHDIVTKGLDIMPDSVRLLKLATAQYLLRQMHADALPHLETLYNIEPSDDSTIVLLITINLSLLNLISADSIYQSNLRELPCLKVLGIYFVIAHLRMGNTAKAQETFSKIQATTWSQISACADRFGIDKAHYEKSLTKIIQELK